MEVSCTVFPVPIMHPPPFYQKAPNSSQSFVSQATEVSCTQHSLSVRVPWPNYASSSLLPKSSKLELIICSTGYSRAEVQGGELYSAFPFSKGSLAQLCIILPSTQKLQTRADNLLLRLQPGRR